MEIKSLSSCLACYHAQPCPQCSFLRRFNIFEFDRTLRVQPDGEAARSVPALDTVGAISLPKRAYLAYLTELDAVSVRRNSSNHFENSLFDFILTDARSLVSRYRKSLLSKRYKDYSSYIEAFVYEKTKTTPAILRLSSTRHAAHRLIATMREKMKRKKTKKLGQS